MAPAYARSRMAGNLESNDGSDYPCRGAKKIAWAAPRRKNAMISANLEQWQICGAYAELDNFGSHATTCIDVLVFAIIVWRKSSNNLWKPTALLSILKVSFITDLWCSCMQCGLGLRCFEFTWVSCSQHQLLFTKHTPRTHV